MAGIGTISKDEARRLIEACFAKLTADTEANAPSFDDPAREINEQRRMVYERLQELGAQAQSGKFEPDIHAMLTSVLQAHGRAGEVLTPGLRHDLLEGITRALAEQERLYEFRLRDRLAPYEPLDPFFARAQTSIPSTAPPTPAAAASPEAIGPTVRETIDRYLKAKRKSWVVKTSVNRRRQLELLVEHLGPDRRLQLVTTDDLRAFRDGLMRLRRKHHVGASTTFIGRQTDDEALQIEAKTALLHLQNARSCLLWAVSEGYLGADPSRGLTVEQPKAKKAHRARRSFKALELEKLFSSPTFTGCKGPRRRSVPGQMIIRDAQYWLPLLGYYTGARMGELVQLHVADVQLDGPHPHIQINEDGGGEVGSGSEKHVKSIAGIRRVPLHPHLIELGFSDFVKKRRTDARATQRLFYEINFGQDGQASTTYSKRFARLLDGVGLTDKALVFHSFRHTAEDAFRDALQPQYVIDRIIGHADEAISGQYGQGISLEVAATAVDAIRLPMDPRPVLRPQKGVLAKV